MNGGPARPVVLVLARHYARGPVKTRLAADVGADAARSLYRRLAERVWAGLADPGFDRWLLVEPAEVVAEAAAWLAGADRILPQATGTLGERLSAGFRHAFSSGATAAVAVGTDAPAVDAACVRAALRALAEQEVVLVPSLDGGYALIGMTAPVEELFRDIPWSTDRVLEMTRERLRGLGLTWSELPPVRDLDTVADLRALEAEGYPVR